MFKQEVVFHRSPSERTVHGRGRRGQSMKVSHMSQEYLDPHCWKMVSRQKMFPDARAALATAGQPKDYQGWPTHCLPCGRKPGSLKGKESITKEDMDSSGLCPSLQLLHIKVHYKQSKNTHGILGENCQTYNQLFHILINNLIQGRLGGLVSWASNFGSGHDLMVREFEPRVGLCAVSSEPGACFIFCVSLSLCPSPTHALSLSKNE